jgi:hypothetical protein
MSYDAQRIAVQNYVKANWSSTPIVYDENDPPVHQMQWIRVTFADAPSFQASIGGSSVRYRHPGLLIIEVYVTEDVGRGAATRYGDTIAALFRGRTVGDTLFRSPTVRQVGRDKGWYRVNVEIPFQRDECF